MPWSSLIFLLQQDRLRLVLFVWAFPIILEKWKGGKQQNFTRINSMHDYTSWKNHSQLQAIFAICLSQTCPYFILSTFTVSKISPKNAAKIIFTGWKATLSVFSLLNLYLILWNIIVRYLALIYIFIYVINFFSFVCSKLLLFPCTTSYICHGKMFFGLNVLWSVCSVPTLPAWNSFC